MTTNTTANNTVKATRKSTRGKAPTTASFNASNARFTTTMLHDLGLSVHKCSVTVSNCKSTAQAKQALQAFAQAVNTAISNEADVSEIPLAPSTMLTKQATADAENNTVQVFLELPKIPKHSKDGYAAYKRAITQAKVAIRTGTVEAK